jgi:hypothetical protein
MAGRESVRSLQIMKKYGDRGWADCPLNDLPFVGNPRIILADKKL